MAHDETDLFFEIVDLLNGYTGEGLMSIAEEADLHWTTLYSWISYKTISPRISSLHRVAKVLGYEIKLTKPKVKLRIVK